ncbi:MAG: protein kinase [Planctomycetota bacterium]
MADAPAPKPAVTTLSLKPGDTVDAYTVVDTIATTGSAVVYKAHDALLDRHVAIKQIILGSEDSDLALRKRIREEASIHKRVSTTQPKHLIQFIDAVDDPRGLMLVSEFYPSTSLEALLQDRDAPLEERQALGIVAATALGLQAIHAAGVIHRDLKPSNILLGQDRGLKICDFGLAAIIESQESLALGSVRYMAPELLRSEPADGRADVYSLGIIAYEMLAGRTHFDTAFRNVLRDQRNQAMRWMKWHTNARAAAPTLDTYLPDLPPHLVQLVARMMDKDPARRVAAAEDIVHAIRRHFTGDEPDAQPASPYPGLPAHASSPGASTGGDTAPLPSRNRVPLFLAALLLFWVVVGTVLFIVSDQKKAAQLAQRTADARAAINQGIELYDQGDYAAALARYQAVLADFDPAVKPGKDAQLGVWKTQGRIALNQARYDEAVDYLTRYREAGGDPASVETLIGEARINEAFAQITASVRDTVDAGDFDDAQQTLRDARQQDWTDRQLATLDELDQLVRDRRAQALAADRLAQARQLVADNNRPAAIASLVELGALPPEGEAYLRQLQADQTFDDAMKNGEAALRTGRLADAVQAFRAALAVRPSEALDTRVRALDARRLTQEAATLIEAGQYPTADLRLAQALRLAPDNPDALRLQQSLTDAARLSAIESRGDQSLAAGNLDAALTAYEQALAISPGNSRITTKLGNLRFRLALQNARAAFDNEQLPQARALLEEAQRLAPNDQNVQALLAQLDTRERYRKFLDDADAAKELKDFRRAKQLVREAGKLVPGEEVDRRLEDLDFENFLALGQEYLDADELEAAAAILNQARNIRITTELLRLLEAVEDAQAQRSNNPGQG